ncbi:MAG: VCBS repeat-containing protein [Ignavibacteriaceae bacterium]|nr:VCBS repeat-containing protein [Ignavibacteriaceae bacterium]
MKLKLVCCLLLIVSSSSLAQLSSEEKVEQLKSRTDIKVTDIEKDILKLEYTNGKVLYKNISDYQSPITNNLNYSPTYDSTIIDLTTIDTTLYYQKYNFWQEVPIHNWDFECLRIGDVNNNGKPELYGARKFFETPAEPITIYELNNSEMFENMFQYDSVFIARSIHDVDWDGREEVLLTLPPLFGIGSQQRFFSKDSDSSLATILNFIFNPDLPYQLDDPTLGEFDDDQKTDLVFDKASNVYIFEYNPIINNFDSVYHFQVPDPIDLDVGGYSVGDFDLDGKTDIVFGTMRGNVFVIENQADNQYTNSWWGSIDSYHAYIHTCTNDIDKNGKPEFWVLGDAYYNEIGTTRITIFETNGDNSYYALGRVDLVGVFSFYAGTMQAVDIDNDGTEEIAVCIDENFIILKFNGSQNHQTYEVYYIKQNELNTLEEWQTYFGAIMYDLLNDGEPEILISMAHTINTQPNIISRGVTKIYSSDSTTSVEEDEILPISNELFQNYPNPFNPATNIKFQLKKTETVYIKVYNVLGKEIRTLLENNLTPGEHTIKWNANDDKGNVLPGGVYFIQMIAGSYQKTIKTILLK